jgi:hypothetical protein
MPDDRVAIFPRPDPERIDLPALKTDVECVMWQIAKLCRDLVHARSLGRVRAVRSGDRRHRDVVAARLGVRLEPTELPMAKSSEASDTPARIATAGTAPLRTSRLLRSVSAMQTTYHDLRSSGMNALADLDELQLSMWVQVWRAVIMIGVKAMLDGTLEREIAGGRDREQRLEELARRLGAAEVEGAPRPGRSLVRGKPGCRGGVAGNWGAASEISRYFREYC